MKIRDDIAELLHQGLSDREICRQVHCDPRTTARTRDALGIPRNPPGRPRSATSLEAAFRARTEPVDGGHLRWTGYLSTHGTPRFKYGKTFLTARRVAFKIRTGREPHGNALPSCDFPGCVAPDHIDDQRIRDRDRATYAAIFGGA